MLKLLKSYVTYVYEYKLNKNSKIHNYEILYFSAEKLFGEMAKLGQNALFPLVVVNSNFISIRYEFYDEERCMYNLLQNTNG